MVALYSGLGKFGTGPLMSLPDKALSIFPDCPEAQRYKRVRLIPFLGLLRAIRRGAPEPE